MHGIMLLQWREDHCHGVYGRYNGRIYIVSPLKARYPLTSFALKCRMCQVTKEREEKCSF